MKVLTAICLVAVMVITAMAGESNLNKTSPRFNPQSAWVKKLFAKPPTEYSSAPLWVWNDLLTEEQIVSSLRDLAAQQVKQVFVHPRPGLMTPYLSDDWFRLWKVAVQEAEKLDMNVWIYDENSYPSGFAGGWVPRLMPESRGRGLVLREESQPPKAAPELLAAYNIQNGKVQNITDNVRKGESLPSGTYWSATVVRAKDSPWNAGGPYVDLLYPGVTEKFIEVTLEPYRRHLGDQFGKRIPGSFTDEPELQPAGGLPWTDGLPDLFQKRWGYSLTDNLVSLKMQVGDWRKVRHNYYQLLSELFIERWAKPYYEYCKKYNLEFTGHYWEHEWPNCAIVPDNMAMYAWHQRPAIDILMNQYQENTHAQFGNVRSMRELSSVANQLGLPRTLCEAYGAGGWDLRFEDMKRIGDWLYVLGVNTMDQHLTYITLRGARKRDHPQSFSYHEPWWPLYHYSASYFERLSAAICQGQQINRILVLEPTTSAWMHNQGGGKSSELEQLGQSFFNLLMDLERNQVEYDLGCEDIMSRHGRVDSDNNKRKTAQLVVGKRAYEIVVLPPATENLNASTVALLEKFLRQGGHVLSCGNEPPFVDGNSSNQILPLTRMAGWKKITSQNLCSELTSRLTPDGFAIKTQADNRGNLFHHRRQWADGQLLFLVNTSMDKPSEGTVESSLRGVEIWDLNSGTTSVYPFTNRKSGIEFNFRLPPSGSMLLLLTQKKLRSQNITGQQVVEIEPVKAPAVERKESNVLVLDFVDALAKNQSLKKAYFYQANQWIFRQNGMARNPWDSSVQYQDEFLKMKFGSDTGFEATYRFSIQGSVPASLAIVLERPDLYSITCNGKKIIPKPGAWWLDKAFGCLDLAGIAREGENEVTIKATPFSIFHELESAYLIGDFYVKSTDAGFAITASQPLKLGPWNEQGHPFYSAGVRYRHEFNTTKKEGSYFVSLPSWYGSVAEVVVNGKPAGHIGSPPWECDVTSSIKPGMNTVEVLVIGTLKNTLGPHHNGPGLGSAWPGMFQKGPASGPPPGKQYHTVQYGLYQPAKLLQKLDIRVK